MQQATPRPHETARVKRGYITVAEQQVHYRTAGTGPAIVMLHDSPRSSRLHLDTMLRLAPYFTVFALDTPGYGCSDPLPLADPTIGDFAAALGAALEALNLLSAPLYATHTSAKIAIEHAARTGGPCRLVLDGLSIPAKLADPSFVDAYMRPFRIEPSGGYLASEWTRIRDMLRWFPWFTATPANRMAMDRPDHEWVRQYTIDLFSAGPYYSSAYGAAMRYDPMPALKAVAVPTIVAARSDDVLYSFLDDVPVDANAALEVNRLGADRERWLEWLIDALSVPGERQPPQLENRAAADGRAYLDLPHGQLHLHRRGSGNGRPLLILEAPTNMVALAWQDRLFCDCEIIVPDLPGYGESDPLPAGDRPDGLIAALAAVVEHLGGRVDVMGIGAGADLAMALAARHPDMVGAMVIDGALDHAADLAEHLLDHPDFAPNSAGTHLHSIWHMLRDAQVQHPWRATAAGAARRTDPLMDAQALHGALLGVLKQPANYGDAAGAAAACAASAGGKLNGCPALVFTCADDPFYAGVNRIAAALPAATMRDRPATFDETEAIIAGFLSTRPGARSPA